MIVNLDSDSGAACEKKAQDAGIPSIDYDRLTLGGVANYYVSFDNVQVGKLMGDGLHRVPRRRRQDQGQHRLDQRRPDRQQRRPVQAGLRRGAQAASTTRATTSRSATRPASGTPPWPRPTFEQLFTQNGGKIDGVISANDTMAGGIVTVLKNNNLAGKVPVTGQDASDEGLQRVIAGTQCGTVFKDVNLEAEAASEAGHRAWSRTTARPTPWSTARSRTPQTNKDVASVFATPVWVTQANIKAPFDAGYTDGAEGLHRRRSRRPAPSSACPSPDAGARSGAAGPGPCASRTARPSVLLVPIANHDAGEVP